MKKTYKYLIAAAAVLAVLAAAFLAGGPPDSAAPDDTPASAPEQTAQQEQLADQTAAPETPAAPAEQSGTTVAPEATKQPSGEAEVPKTDPEPQQDQYHTDPVPEGKPAPVEPENTQVTDSTYTCTISISCATILDNLEELDPEKTELVPEDGWLLEPISVSFQEGESVFDVLQRVCREQKLHMEFVDTPMYNSAYIEGIGNLYEFDCGNLSGWMYCVNEWFPNYGCSRYSLQNGDVIRWVYTCDLGADVGDNSLAGA